MSLCAALSVPTIVYGDNMNFGKMLSAVPPEAKLTSEEYHTWGASMVRDSDGLCHLFYSRWSRKHGFDAWVTHSEVAHAVADEPTGPYRHVDVALPVRGSAFWDGLCTHNPTVHAFEGKYYLYYMGTTLQDETTKNQWYGFRNNQRIGVAVADHPNGPWKRFDQPLIDVGDNDKDHDALMTSNPSICRLPSGEYLLVYKCVGKKGGLPRGGPVVHMVATSDSPTGPFRKHPNPVFTAKKSSFPAEDPYIWVQGEKLWAIVKDMHGAFTGKHALALFRSDDGFNWQLADNPLVTGTEVTWQDGTTEKLDRLERPQLWLENGIPAVLFCAAKKRGTTFNIHIPLRDVDEE
jgi:hypothetical protein